MNNGDMPKTKNNANVNPDECFFDFANVIKDSCDFTYASSGSAGTVNCSFLPRNKPIDAATTKEKGIGKFSGKTLKIGNKTYKTNDEEQSSIQIMSMENSNDAGVVYHVFNKKDLGNNVIISTGSLSGCIAGMFEFEDSILFFHEGAKSAEATVTAPQKSILQSIKKVFVKEEPQDMSQIYTQRCEDIKKVFLKSAPGAKPIAQAQKNYTNISCINEMIQCFESSGSLIRGSLMFRHIDVDIRYGLTACKRISFTNYAKFEVGDENGKGNLIYMKKNNESRFISRIKDSGDPTKIRSVILRQAGELTVVDSGNQQISSIKPLDSTKLKLTPKATQKTTERQHKDPEVEFDDVAK